jgi:alcohol/geraniol dehydrogenase (NADP+)
MPTYHAYAAPSAKAPLEPFTFDPGPLGPEEVEIEVSYCGVCHSDLSMLNNDWGMSKYPFVPGHEVTGTVSALGEQAKGLKTGQRVGLGWWSQSCLSCHECLSGDHHLCSSVQGTIVGRHGAFADRVRAQWTWVRPIPDGLDMATTGPLLCGGVTVFTPLLINNVRSTARVGIIGVGGLGHMALQFANKWGCEVHAFTTSDSKEAEARKLGAHFVQYQAGRYVEEAREKPRPHYLYRERSAGRLRPSRHARPERTPPQRGSRSQALGGSRLQPNPWPEISIRFAGRKPGGN